MQSESTSRGEGERSNELPRVAEPESEIGSTSVVLRAVERSATVVRVIKTPFHLTGSGRSRLKHTAFRPPPDSNEVSVVQQSYAGDDYCKQVGVGNAGVHYKGLAPGLVDSILAAGAKAVLDTPEGNYPGHADIITPLPSPPRGEPLSAEDAKVMSDFCDELVKRFAYYEDPDVACGRWNGPPLARAS